MITVKLEKTSGLMKLNGFNIRYDEAVFSDMLEAEKFIKGEPAFNYLDDRVVLGTNYKVIGMEVDKDE